MGNRYLKIVMLFKIFINNLNIYFNIIQIIIKNNKVNKINSK